MELQNMALAKVTVSEGRCNPNYHIGSHIYGADGLTINIGSIDCRSKLNLMNLGFMEDFGNGLQKASQYGSQAYKIGKQIAPVAGEAL